MRASCSRSPSFSRWSAHSCSFSGPQRVHGVPVELDDDCIAVAAIGEPAAVAFDSSLMRLWPSPWSTVDGGATGDHEERARSAIESESELLSEPCVTRWSHATCAEGEVGVAIALKLRKCAQFSGVLKSNDTRWLFRVQYYGWDVILWLESECRNYLYHNIVAREKTQLIGEVRVTQSQSGISKPERDKMWSRSATGASRQLMPRTLRSWCNTRLLSRSSSSSGSSSSPTQLLHLLEQVAAGKVRTTHACQSMCLQ